ncbi:MAG: cupin domain-containing protein [Pseudolysinimonas sp.]|jgi:quercetin dioxygenase-like cupin family protein
MIITHASTEPRPPAKASRFTGRAVGDAVMPSTDGVIINTVTFEPGARTHWHTHEHGQILYVLAGYGLICTHGEAPQQLRAGDWVWIPPGERHWHGATPETFLSHTAISLGATQWSDEVTAEEYASAPQHVEGHRNDE